MVYSLIIDCEFHHTSLHADKKVSGSSNCVYLWSLIEGVHLLVGERGIQCGVGGGWEDLLDCMEEGVSQCGSVVEVEEGDCPDVEKQGASIADLGVLTWKRGPGGAGGEGGRVEVQ